MAQAQTPTEEELKQERAERAQAAVKKFNTMLPSLRRYARKVTGNPRLNVRAGKSSETDGNTIFIMPPISLGDNVNHNGKCSQFVDGVPLCPACEARQHLMEILEHEIGHILYGSFDKWDAPKVVEILRNAEVRCYESAPRFTMSMRNSFRYGEADQPLIYHVNQAAHPWMSLLTLCAEDARCDELRLRYDPTQQYIFDKTSRRYLDEGITQLDGTHRYYKELDRNVQACLAWLYSARTDYPLDGFFDDDVIDLINDKEIKKLANKSLDATETVESFAIVLETLELFNNKGFCKVDNKTDEELEQIIEELAKLLVLIFGHDHTLGTPGGGGAGGRGGNDSAAGRNDGLRPEDIANALATLSQDEEPINVADPLVHLKLTDGGRGWGVGKGVGDFKSDERNLSPAITQARLAFDVNARAKRYRNQRSGKVAAKTLAKRVPFGDERVFSKRVTPDKRDYAVVIGMDISGSTSGHTLTEEKFAVLGMCDLLARLGIKFELWAHSTATTLSDFKDYPDLYQIKDQSTPWSDETRKVLENMRSCGANLDGHTLRFYRKRLESMRATDRVLMYYTDGAMPASNYAEELKVLKSEINYAHKHGITLMAVGMGTDSPVEHGFDTCQVDSPKDYRKVVEHLGKRLQ